MSAETKVTTTTKRPASNRGDLGIVIFPSENLAIAQNIIATDSPTTRRRVLDASIETRVKGIKNKGRRVIVQNKDQKEILSNIFDHIVKKNYLLNANKLVIRIILQRIRQLNNYVDKSARDKYNLFRSVAS